MIVCGKIRILQSRYIDYDDKKNIYIDYNFLNFLKLMSF